MKSGSPYSNLADARVLSVWSGRRAPLIDGVPDYDQFRDVLRYRNELGELGWVPGHKYFYGHDVDGGEPLASAALSRTAPDEPASDSGADSGADERGLRLVDHLGGEVAHGSVTLEQFAAAFDELESADIEHDRVALADADEWSLEFARDQVEFENLEPDGERLGTLAFEGREHALSIAGAFIDGDFDALRALAWTAN